MLADRYDLGDRIGSGGMADVFRATDRVLHREVAVKVLRATADDETDRQRFTAEARTLARLSHPHLVMVLDAGTTTDQPYLVMELVEGTTLSERVRDATLSSVEAATIGAQVAEALAYAHGSGIVHRDVKPGNVLLGHDGRVKLADFGIARLMGDAVHHTLTGHTIGTAAYLAPEQVRGEELTPAVDVYALGLVLLESLTGVRAYPGTPTEAALARLHRPPHVPDSLPEVWQVLIPAMTAMTATERPSAAEAADALREVRDHLADATALRTVRRIPLAAAPVAPAAQPSLLARAAGVPLRLRAMGAAAVATVLLALAASGIWSSTPATGDIPSAAPSRSAAATPSSSPSATPTQPARTSPAVVQVRPEKKRTRGAGQAGTRVPRASGGATKSKGPGKTKQKPGKIKHGKGNGKGNGNGNGNGKGNGKGR